LVTKYIVYDPNYNYADDDDEEMQDEEGAGDYGEEWGDDGGD